MRALIAAVSVPPLNSLLVGVSAPLWLFNVSLFVRVHCWPEWRLLPPDGERVRALVSELVESLRCL